MRNTSIEQALLLWQSSQAGLLLSFRAQIWAQSPVVLARAVLVVHCRYDPAEHIRLASWICGLSQPRAGPAPQASAQEETAGAAGCQGRLPRQGELAITAAGCVGPHGEGHLPGRWRPGYRDRLPRGGPCTVLKQGPPQTGTDSLKCRICTSWTLGWKQALTCPTHAEEASAGEAAASKATHVLWGCV